ncbi:DNA helicase [Microbacterium gallinarum]|uniref:DNA helicase n=1 Tax=Microbacterium gallinarum TaxID=2762209 RepID=A0ABR8X161_9MICO|nr:DNA helicase [Microbacterium gallinarum]MBD8023048.1 DNA helicase [Microbacterium gallinarum]
MSLSRKRKKELRKLQTQATSLWESQQVLVGEAASVAREAGRQLGHLNREQVKPRVTAGYETYAAPYVEKGKRVVNDTVIPAAGAVVGSAMSVWDAANDTRSRLASGRGLDFSAFKKPAPAPVKKGMGAGGVIAIILGVAAALGVLYAAWQTLRADDELWVADDPLRAPDA